MNPPSSLGRSRTPTKVQIVTERRCDCGATAGPLGTCVDYYHAILAEEQGDPQMYRWHAPVVCAYLLQHPARSRGTRAGRPTT